MGKGGPRRWKNIQKKEERKIKSTVDSVLNKKSSAELAQVTLEGKRLKGTRPTDTEVVAQSYKRRQTQPIQNESAKPWALSWVLPWQHTLSLSFMVSTRRQQSAARSGKPKMLTQTNRTRCLTKEPSGSGQSIARARNLARVRVTQNSASAQTAASCTHQSLLLEKKKERKAVNRLTDEVKRVNTAVRINTQQMLTCCMRVD